MMPLSQSLIQILTSFIGTLGFGFLFHIRGKKLLFAAVGGMLSWLCFLLLQPLCPDEVLRYFLVSALLTVYSEVLARLFKTPSATFCIISLIPLVPGSSLYYTMANALGGNAAGFVAKGLYTLELTAALSLGIVLVTAIFNFKRRKNNDPKNAE